MQNPWISAAVRRNWPQPSVRIGHAVFQRNWASTSCNSSKHFNTLSGFALGGRSTLRSHPFSRFLGEIRTKMFVSILIPCYNAERWVAQAIESALAQTWSEKEVIVMDDGSRDGSLEVIKSFGARIVWETGPNRGGNVARNRLLELARGEWLQYLDADDYLLPLKIERQVTFLREHPACDVVYSPVLWVNWSEQKIEQEVTPI